MLPVWQTCGCCATSVQQTNQCESCATWVCDTCMADWDGCCIACKVTFPSASTIQPRVHELTHDFQQTAQRCFAMVANHTPLQQPLTPQAGVGLSSWSKDGGDLCMTSSTRSDSTNGGSSTRSSTPTAYQARRDHAWACDCFDGSVGGGESPTGPRSSLGRKVTVDRQRASDAPRDSGHDDIDDTVGHRPKFVKRKSNTLYKPTTMMLRNLPCRLDYGDIIEAISSAGYGGTFEFVYLPQRTGQHTSNLGYAFVNFFKAEVAKRFSVDFDGHCFYGTQSVKRCFVVVADHQGFNAYSAQMRRHARSIGNHHTSADNSG